jgi:hypothetical protein
MPLSAEERGGPAISLFTPADKEMRFLSFILFRLVLLSPPIKGIGDPTDNIQIQFITASAPPVLYPVSINVNSFVHTL